MMKPKILLLLSVCLLVACGPKVEYDGEGILNYPNMPELIKDNIEPYEKGVYMYQQVIIENNKKDTTILKADQVDWEAIKKPFLEADIFKKKFDRMYKLDFFEDTLSGTKTWLFTSLNQKLATKKMSLQVRNEDNAIVSLYAETNDVGLISSSAYKLLFASGKTIQIQEESKKPFSKKVKRIVNLSFLN